MELISFILLDRTNIKCQNRPVLPPAQVFYFIGQALHTYHSRFIPEGVAASQIFLRDAHVLPKLPIRNTAK
jgi:hypothetical protein